MNTVLLSFILYITLLAVSLGQDQSLYTVKGTVSLSKNNKPLEGVTIYAFRVIRDGKGNISNYQAQESSNAVTNEKGKFSLLLNGKFEYQVSCIKEGLVPSPEVFNFKPNQASGEQNISIDIPMMPFEGLLLKGKVKDRLTNQSLAGAKVELFDTETGVQHFVTTQEDGSYFFRLQADKRYVVKAVYKDYFLGSSKPFDTHTHDKSKKTHLEDIKLEKITIGLVKNVPYFFDVNSAEINSAGKPILFDLHVLLMSNPGVRFEVAVHTDSRGHDDYNYTLSEMQAQAIVDYLHDEMGHSLVRLKPIGYGENQLRNNCENGVFCSTSKHLENRRIELKVLGWIED